MKWLLLVLLAAAPAIARDRTLAVSAIEGVLPRADAAALEEVVRTEARALQIAVATDGAPFTVTGKSVRLEGALAVTLSVVKTADGTRLATERLVGFSLADLQHEGQKKIPRLLRAGFGLDPPPTPKQLHLEGERFRPYRSLVAWYCWRAVDTVTPG